MCIDSLVSAEIAGSWQTTFLTKLLVVIGNDGAKQLWKACYVIDAMELLQLLSLVALIAHERKC